MLDLPVYVWVLVLLGVLGLPAVTAGVLYRGSVAAGLSARTATWVTAGAAVVFGGWLAISWALAGSGFYSQGAEQGNP